MLSNPYQEYQQTRTATASRGELVVLLYEGAIAFLGRGCLAIERKDYEQAHRLFIQAQNILWELRSTLDHRAGGKLAERLAALYDYMVERVVAANVAKDPAPAQEVAGLLRELLPAWRTAASSVVSAQALAV